MPVYRNYYLDKKGVYHASRNIYGTAALAAISAEQVMKNGNDYISIGGKIIKKKQIKEVHQEIDNDTIGQADRSYDVWNDIPEIMSYSTGINWLSGIGAR